LLSQIPSSINYTESNGLPSNEAYYVFQDHKGFIWITTDNGAVKFDGLNFDLYNKQNGLADNVNFSIHGDSRDRLWFRSFTGALSVFDQDSMYKYPLNKKVQEFLDKSIIFSLIVDKFDSVHISMSSVGIIMDIDSNYNYKVRFVPPKSLVVRSIDDKDPLIVYRRTPGTLKELIFNGAHQKIIQYDSSGNNVILEPK
jgi:ligand-binding sensor domain-containing protein